MEILNSSFPGIKKQHASTVFFLKQLRFYFISKKTTLSDSQTPIKLNLIENSKMLKICEECAPSTSNCEMAQIVSDENLFMIFLVGCFSVSRCGSGGQYWRRKFLSNMSYMILTPLTGGERNKTVKR